MSIHCYSKKKSYNNKLELILKFEVSILKMPHSFYSKMFLQYMTNGKVKTFFFYNKYIKTLKKYFDD